MKIIKLTNDITIEWNSNSNYTVIAPTNTFKDINEAIAIYPELKDAKYIAKCDFCNKYFVKYKANRRKYCSNSCSEEANRLKTNKRKLKQRNTIKNRNKAIINEYKTQKQLPQEFNQIDSIPCEAVNNNALGEVQLYDSNSDKEHDWDKELQIIRKLKHDLYKDNTINP